MKTEARPGFRERYSLTDRPVAEIRSDEIASKETSIGGLRIKARGWYKTLANQDISNPELGPVQFGRRGIREAIAQSPASRAGELKLRAFPAVPEVIRRGAVRIEENRDPITKHFVEQYARVRAPVTIDGDPHEVEVLLEKRKDGHWYYNHTVEARSLRPTDSGGAIGDADLSATTAPAQSKSGTGSAPDIVEEPSKDNEAPRERRVDPDRAVIDPVDGARADFAKRLEKLNLSDKVRVRAVNSIFNREEGRFDRRIQGHYLDRLITVALDAVQDPAVTLDHEIVHALRDMGLIKDMEWRALAKAALADKALMANIRKRYAQQGLSEDALIEEAIADMFARWAAGDHVLKGFERTAFERIRDFLIQLGEALGLHFRSAEDVMRAIERGEIGSREIANDNSGRGKFSLVEDVEPDPDSPLNRGRRKTMHHPFPDADMEAAYLSEDSLGPPRPKGMKNPDYELFARKLFLDDRTWNIMLGDSIDERFTPEQLQAARVKIDKAVDKSETVLNAVRRYKLQRMIAEQAKTITPADIRPEPTEEIKAANIKLENLDSTEAISGALKAVADQFDDFTEARRGVQSHEATEEMAKLLGMTTSKLMERNKGQAFNAEQLLAARQLLVASADNLVELASKAEGGSDRDLVNFRKAWVRHVAIQEQVSGLTAEAGRALNQFRIMAKAGGDVNARMLREIINTEGRDSIEDVARAITGMKGDPERMNSFIRDAYKPTWRDKIFELWINSLLSGPATHVVNVVSNTLTAVTQIPEQAIAAGLGAGRSLFRPDTERVLMSEVGARAAGLIQGAKEGAIAAAEAIRTGEGSDPLSKIEARQHRAISGLKGEIVRVPSRMLVAGDEFFKAVAMRSSFAAAATRLATREGLKGDELRAHIAELIADPTDAMIEEATDHARYSTFQRPLGEMGQSLTNFINKWHLRAILPFIRTPANIFKYSLERTPAAPLLKEVREDLKAGGSRADVAMGRIVFGSGLGAAAVMLALQGIITGGDPDDDDQRRLLRSMGWQPYSVRIGETYYSYARLDPLATVLGLAADLAASHENMSEEERQKRTVNVFKAILAQLQNKTFLSGFGGLLEAVQDSARYGENFVAKLVGSVVPTGVAQINNSIDPVVRDTHADGVVDAAVKRIESRIPGLSDNLPAKRDVWGRILKREGGAGPDVASPIWVSTSHDDPVTAALLRAGVSVGPPSRRIGGAELSASDYDRYQEVAGSRLREAAEDLVKSRAWQSADDDDRVEMFDSVKNRARKAARRELGLSAR
jgi:hypothetical protein